MTSILLPVKLLLGIALLCPFHISSTEAACDKCKLPSLPYCQLGQVPPADGVPPCICSASAPSRGCFLKPCDMITTRSDIPCDSSFGLGSIPERSMAYNFRCFGRNGECETCKSTPSDCTYLSFINPPASGGPSCACADNQMMPPGCTLKLCSKMSHPKNPDRCICEPGIPSILCFNATCPGNFKGGANGSQFIASSPITLIFALVSELQVRMCRK